MSNSLCQFWNVKSVPLQIFNHSSVSLIITPLYVCSLCIFNFGQKDPMKIPVLTLSSVLMKICQIPHVIFQTTGRFFFKFFMTLHCHETELLCTFLGQTLYTLHKTDQSKCNFFRIFSAPIKINQILVIFETKNKFLFTFCTTLWYHEIYFFHTFFSLKFIYFQQK